MATAVITRLLVVFFIIVAFSIDPSSGDLVNLNSLSMRNARWLNENQLSWYHSYVPDVLKLLAKSASEDGVDDDQRPGYDPGELPSVQQINFRLRTLCSKTNATFAALNMSRSCAADLGFLICRGTELTNSLVEMASKYCQTQGANARACQEQVNKRRIENTWTSKFVDSFGKVSGGWHSGSYMHLGSYQECTQMIVKRPSSSGANQQQQEDFTGKYCVASFSTPLSPTRSSLATTCHKRNFTQACAPTSSGYGVRWGFCVPKTCSIREANVLVHALFIVSNVSLCPEKPLVLCVEKPPLGEDIPAIAMTVVCAVLAAIIIAGTTYDLVDRRILTREWLGCFGGEKTDAKDYSHENLKHEPTEIVHGPYHGLEPEQRHYRWSSKLLLTFSIYTNVRMMLKTKEHGRLKCLDGIRVLTMAWVVLAQSHVLLLDFIGNATAMLRMPGVLSYQFINNGSYSTDTFLLVAGILHAWVWLRKDSGGDDTRRAPGAVKKIGFAILKRLLRILPVYMLVLGLATAFWAHVGEGPMWTTARYHHGGPFFCQYTWWINLMFLNNFLGLDYPCMGWTWHLAVDMQLFLLAIPILVLYKKRSLAGFLVSVVLVLLSIILNGIIVASYSLSPSLLGSTDLSRYDSINEYYRKIFVKPYMRWNAYLIGIFIGYVLKRSERNDNMKALKFLRMRPINMAAWALIVGVCSSLVYGLFDFASGRTPSPAAVIIYAAFSRTIWSAVIGLLVLLCLRTSKGLVYWFLTWSIWTPLARVTYCVFLLHSLVIVFFYGTSKEWFQFSFGNGIYFWLSTLLMSYALGLLAFICIEAPAVRIGRIFFDTSAGSSFEAPGHPLLERDAATAPPMMIGRTDEKAQR